MVSSAKHTEEHMAMSATPASGEIPVNRWTQMIIGVVCMVLIANMQYGWTLFVYPMAKANIGDGPGFRFAFSIFTALGTWLTPLEGWLADPLGPHRGPKLVVAFGGLF